jgi:hypothetical protein
MKIIASPPIVTLAFIVVSMFMPLLAIVPTYAAQCDPSKNSEGKEITFLGLPTWYKYLDGDNSSGKCTPTLSGSDEETKVNSVLPIGLAILETIIRLAGIVAVVMIFVSGFRYITSQGNPEAAVAARKTAFNALIGLVIVVTSTGLVSFIGNRLTGG